MNRGPHGTLLHCNPPLVDATATPTEWLAGSFESADATGWAGGSAEPPGDWSGTTADGPAPTGPTR